MGSGEMSGTMVEVYKSLLKRCKRDSDVVFLDTPAGFQLNVDDISAKAVAYFKTRVQRNLTIASLKSADRIDAVEKASAYDVLEQAKFILMGPGSPTYAVDEWKKTRVPEIFQHVISNGGCITASSAAALTMGSHTLPVYEIYKVGQSPHWVDGLHLLDCFGFDWAVMPHWNNREGGHHDTRFCFMGEQRLTRLMGLLPPSTTIVGLDEHTALQIELDSGNAVVKGLGQVTFLNKHGKWQFGKEDDIPTALLYGDGVPAVKRSPAEFMTEADGGDVQLDNQAEDPLWEKIHDMESQVKRHLQYNRIAPAVRVIMEFEAHIWQVRDRLEEKEALGAAREVFRELVAGLGTVLDNGDATILSKDFLLNRQTLSHLVNNVLSLRETFRQNSQWEMADALRDCLVESNINIQDTAVGVQWEIDGINE